MTHAAKSAVSESIGRMPVAQLSARLLWPAASPRWRKAALAVGGAALLAVSAKVQIPFYPVPQTLQTMVVLLLGMAYGGGLGAATVALYLAAGAAGLPVFAGAQAVGLGYFFGPTGGYLLGFLLAAAACGAMAKRGGDQNPLRVAATMAVGNAVIYLFGLAWLGYLIGWDKPVLQLGMLNFLLGDMLKIAFAAAALPPLAFAVRRWAVESDSKSDSDSKSPSDSEGD